MQRLAGSDVTPPLQNGDRRARTRAVWPHRATDTYSAPGGNPEATRPLLARTACFRPAVTVTGVLREPRETLQVPSPANEQHALWMFRRIGLCAFEHAKREDAQSCAPTFRRHEGLVTAPVAAHTVCAFPVVFNPPATRWPNACPPRFRPSAASRSWRSVGRSKRRALRQTSTLAFSALSWMNSRRGSTISPISLEKISSASPRSPIFTCNNVRLSRSSVVSQSCSGFISPRPL